MAMLEPKMCILDETDSGLDVDAMKLVADGVNALRGVGRSFLVITHYQRLLDHIVPDVVHIMADGQIVKSGGADLALEVEEERLCRYPGRGRLDGAARFDTGPRRGQMKRVGAAAGRQVGERARGAPEDRRLIAMGLPQSPRRILEIHKAR